MEAELILNMNDCTRGFTVPIVAETFRICETGEIYAEAIINGTNLDGKVKTVKVNAKTENRLQIEITPVLDMRFTAEEVQSVEVH